MTTISSYLNGIASVHLLCKTTDVSVRPYLRPYVRMYVRTHVRACVRAFLACVRAGGQAGERVSDYYVR